MKTHYVLFLTTLLGIVPARGAVTISHLPWQDSVHRAEPPQSGCPDFSGNWRGTCSDGTATTLNVLQSGCAYFSVGPRSFYVGGLHTESDHVPASTAVDSPFSQTGTRLVQWDKDGKTLRWLETWFLANEGANPVRMDFNGTWQLENDGLYVHLDPNIDCHLKK